MVSNASLLYFSISQTMSCLLHGALGEQRLVLLLGLDECFLEEVGIWIALVSSAQKLRGKGRRHVLSLLANRIARVWGSGSPSLTSAAAFQTQLRSLPTLGESFMSGTTTIINQSISHKAPRSPHPHFPIIQ